MAAPDVMGRGSDSFKADFPSVNAMGTRPLGSRSEGNDSKGRFGEVRATGIVATGRFGGSRDMKPGAQRSPISGRGSR